MKSQYLLIEEVAAEMRCPETTVRYWIRAGKLRASKVGRRFIVARSDLDAVIRANAVGTGEPEEASGV